MTIRNLAGLAACLAVASPACSRPSAPAGPPAVVIDEASRKEADEIFANRCTPCHGPEGAGNGPASATLNPRPRNFQDRAWQTGVTDQHIEQILQYGGSAVGKSAAMPPNPDLVSRPLVVAAVRAKVRSLVK